MRKKSVIILFSVLFLSGQTCADRGQSKYNEALGKWKSSGVESYYIKVQYGEFSPLQGEWELKVENGKVAEAKHNGTGDNRFITQAERFTVDSLYKIAESSGECDESSPLCTTAEYSDVVPYIKSVKRINNSSFKGNLKKDAGYSIVVVEFSRG